MASSLIGDNYQVTCPVYDTPAPDISDEQASKDRAQFLSALWRSWRYVGQEDAFADMRFNLIVRAKACLYVTWIRKQTPASLQSYTPPILFRSLNPCTVGHWSDGVRTRIAYTKYQETYRKLKLRYPEIANLDKVKNSSPSDMINFIDYWEMDGNGVIWNAHIINDTEFLRSPQRSKLPILPIIVRAPERFSLEGKGMQYISILDDTMNEWGEENMMESMLITGIRNRFFPPLVARDTTGADIPDLDTGSDAINEVGPGFEFVSVPNMQPDYQSAVLIQERVHDRIQRGGFPDANFGQADANARSGYLFHQLAQAGQGVIGSITQALQRIMMEGNTLALCMVEKFADEDLTVYAYDAQNNQQRGYSIGAEQVTDKYNNHVTLKPARSANDLQYAAIGLQMNAAKMLSRRSFWQHLAPFEIPDDEEEVIMREQVINDPDLLRARIQEAYFKYFGVPLPPMEPDFQATPQQPPQGQMPLQPPQAFPGMPLPPQAQGQLTPEAMTGDANVDPALFDALMGQGGVPLG